MPDAAEIKTKEIRVNAENLRYIAGLNGLRVVDIGRRFKCSAEQIHRAAKFPEDYPNLYRRICDFLPRRTVN
jgi:hypothetical protein